MKIYWNKIKNDILEAGKELSMVAVYIIGAGLLIGLSPLLIPVSAITVFFQNRYTDLEPNKYLSAYLEIFVAVLLGLAIFVAVLLGLAIFVAVLLGLAIFVAVLLGVDIE